MFLDIDGVLNSFKWMNSAVFQAGRKLDGEERWMTKLDPKAIARLGKIIEQTKCLIVISSSWRILHTCEEIKNFIKNSGDIVVNIIDKTPSLVQYSDAGVYLGHERGYEIQKWLDDHGPVKNFAIIDDNSDMVHLKHKLVQTTFDDGLQDTHVDKLIVLLNEDV